MPQSVESPPLPPSKSVFLNAAGYRALHKPARRLFGCDPNEGRLALKVIVRTGAGMSRREIPSLLAEETIQ